MEGILALDPPAPLEFPFQTPLHPLERLFLSKMLLHYAIMRKMIVPVIKRERILLLMFNTASNNLNFTL